MQKYCTDGTVVTVIYGTMNWGISYNEIDEAEGQKSANFLFTKKEKKFVTASL